MLLFLTKYRLGDQIEKTEMGRTSSTYREEGKVYKGF